MKIALLLPITLSELQPLFPNQILPKGYPYPLFVPLVNHYLSLGHELVICTTDRNLLKSKIFYGENITLFVASSLCRPKLSAMCSFKYEIMQMSHFLKVNNCDVYHAHWTYEFALAALEVDPKKSIITVHDWPPLIYEIFHDYYRLKRYKMSDKVFKYGKHFTTVSPYISHLFSEHYSNSKICVIPNFIQLKLEKLSKLKSLNNTNPLIVAINNGFEDGKNTKILMQAFSIIRNEIPTASLSMYGAGYGSGEAAESWAKENGYAEGIDFKGSADYSTVMNALWDADLLLHTSKEESFGMVLIEAMSQKTAIVAGGKSGAVPWVLSQGKCGRLADITNARDVAENAITVLKSPNLWNSLVSNGSDRVHEFTLEKVANQYLALYEKVNQ